MNLQKLNPWNWFKHEEQNSAEQGVTVPVKKSDYDRQVAVQSPLVQFHQEIDRMFEDVFRNLGFPALNRELSTPGKWMQQLSTFSPELNISSDDKEYTITLEAAGLEDKDININLDDGRLIIQGNKQEETENSDKNFYRIERRYGTFQRLLALPDDADDENIKASMKNGLLTIHIPRKETVGNRARTISIEKS